MIEDKDVESLKAEVKALRTEVKDLKDFIKAMYSMISEDEEYDAPGEFVGGVEVGRFNT
ncbi:MAG: hypothetical protein RBR05_00665 [Candidatus Methanomethylophilaceae archaeon]|nr:hypothetical protein [Candidatus Methanomethylophilaceae archaeon]MDD3378903.1 hypothetical protein [Candidatus Methanomethylophilaceae archaeon]MDY0223900.1 hypothetical protein [Candidatus Methanomethylophilaceae archaeon]